MNSVDRKNLVLPVGSPRCWCARCGLYFKNEAAFTAHQIEPCRSYPMGGCVGGIESGLREVGLKTASIRGTEEVEWTL